MKNNININRDSNFFSNHTCQTACAFLAANLLFAYNTAHSIPPTVAPSTSRTSTVGTSTDPEYCRHKLEDLRKLACSILNLKDVPKKEALKMSTNDLIEQARLALESEKKSLFTPPERKETIEKNLDKLKENLRKLETTNDQQERTAIRQSTWAIWEDAFKKSTNDFVQQARLALRFEKNSRSTSDERREEIEKDLQRLTTLKSEIKEVNVDQYLNANKLAIDNISNETTITRGDVIGKGGFGTVYEGTATTGDRQIDIVIKQGDKADMHQEGKIGKELAATRAKINKNTLLSDIQGFRVFSIPKMLEDGTLIQERIYGLDGCAAMAIGSESPFAKGFVDDPQKAIQRTYGLVSGLHALHQAGKVHHDLKLENIMVEKTKDKEDPFRIRIIDVGGAVTQGTIASVHSGNAAPEFFTNTGECKKIPSRPSYDIYCLGTMLPSLLFGGANAFYQDMFTSFFYDATKRPSLSHFIKTYLQLLENNGQDKKEAKTARDNTILEMFKAMNERMQNNINKSYPEPVRKRLAQMTADCLSMDPENRPTAEHILLALDNMGLSDWSEGNYNIQNNYLTPEAAKIQGQFWWINRNEP